MSRDHATALQPGQQSKRPRLKTNQPNKQKNSSVDELYASLISYTHSGTQEIYQTS